MKNLIFLTLHHYVIQAESSRLSSCLVEVRNKARGLDNPLVNPDWKVRICSENNFPTAAGKYKSSLIIKVLTIYTFSICITYCFTETNFWFAIINLTHDLMILVHQLFPIFFGGGERLDGS